MGWDEDEGPVARLGGERGEAESEAQESLKQRRRVGLACVTTEPQ